MKKEIKKFLYICVLVLFTLAIPSFLGSNQILSCILLFLVALLMLSTDWKKENLIFYFIIALTGPIVESIAIHFGLWTYSNPIVLGVPIWLFFVWGNAGFYITKLKEFIFSFKK